MAINTILYYVELKTFNIRQERYFNILTSNNLNKIKAVISALNGNMYIINEFYVNKINNCNKEFSKIYNIYDKFPGIPLDFDTGFRYYDGFIYFIKNGIYYKFNEYKQKTEETGRGSFTFQLDKHFKIILLKL